jgi:urease accessory protein
MLSRARLLVPFVLLTALLPTVAYAHITGDMGHDFMAGFTHPVSGLDHLLSMLAVGIISTQLKNTYAIWTLPATFVCVMALGGAMGMLGLHMAGAEIGIALSVMLLGASILFGSRLPSAVIYTLVAVFAVCHGYAHGAEMPAHSEALIFAIGFMITTAAIHVAGILIGLSSFRISRGADYLRLAGGAMAGIGAVFVFASLGVAA